MKHFVFDMGGVLIKTVPHKLILNEDSFVQCKNKDEENFFLDTFLNYERGNINTVEFVEILNPYFNKKGLTAEDYKNNYFEINNKFGGIFNSSDLLYSLKNEGYKIYLLSNLHEVSYKYFSSIFDVNIFDEVFLSYKLHMIKPEYEIFNYAINKISDNPDNIFFFDDTLENVEAAKKCKIKAIQTTGETLEKNINLAKKYNNM